MICGDKDLFVLFASGLSKQSINEVYAKASKKRFDFESLSNNGDQKLPSVLKIQPNA